MTRAATPGRNDFLRTFADANLQRMEGDGNERKFTLSFSSEAPYDRPFFGREILDHSPEAVDLTRLNAIGTLLFNHNRDAVVGKVLRAWIDGNRGYAEVEFDPDEQSETIYQKVKGGTLKGVSIGYAITNTEKVREGTRSTDGRFTGPCVIARRWWPYEISIVSVPADGTVGVGRSADLPGTAPPVTQKRKGGNNAMNEKQAQLAENMARQKALTETAANENRAMSYGEQAEYDALQRDIDALISEIAAGQSAQRTQPDSAVPDTQPPAAPNEPQTDSVQRAIEAERRRVADITALCRQFEVDPSEHIREGRDMNQVRALILDKLAREHPPIGSGVRVEESGENDFRRDASDALMLRSGRVAVEQPSDGARQLSSMSLRDLAIECLSREGRSANDLLRMNPDDLYVELTRQFYNPTAAFPAILDQTIRKSIVHLYNRVPTTFQRITTKGSLKDFKTTADHEYVIGGVGDFLLVPENGEIKPDSPRTEMLPQRKLDTYGKQFSMTRQAFINDDIGFLTEVPGLYATAAKKTIDKQVYKLLFEGKTKTIFDGKPLFDKNTYHKNLAATDAAPTAAAIQKMILQMQRQTDQFGDAIYMTPSIILVGVGYEFDLAVIFHSAQVVGSSNNDINPLYNYPLEIVQSPLLNAMTASGAKTPWFMFADNASAKGIQVDYLNGKETPTVRRMETPGQLGFVWDIYLDWGISVCDWRGICRNDGAVIA